MLFFVIKNNNNSFCFTHHDADGGEFPQQVPGGLQGVDEGVVQNTNPGKLLGKGGGVPQTRIGFWGPDAVLPEGPAGGGGAHPIGRADGARVAVL